MHEGHSTLGIERQDPNRFRAAAEPQPAFLQVRAIKASCGSRIGRNEQFAGSSGGRHPRRRVDGIAERSEIGDRSLGSGRPDIGDTRMDRGPDRNGTRWTSVRTGGSSKQRPS